MLKKIKKVYIMIKNIIDNLPIHGYVKTKSIQITNGKSIIERAILIETRDFSSPNVGRSRKCDNCTKRRDGNFGKKCKR